MSAYTVTHVIKYGGRIENDWYPSPELDKLTIHIPETDLVRMRDYYYTNGYYNVTIIRTRLPVWNGSLVELPWKNTITSKSKTEIEGIIKEDPFHKEKLAEYTVIPFTPTI